MLLRMYRIASYITEKITSYSFYIFSVWKDLTLSSEADRSRYKVWDYPIKEKYSHMLETIEKNGMVKTREDGYQRVLDTLDGTFAFIDESARVTLYLESDILVESNIELKHRLTFLFSLQYFLFF